MFDVILPSVRRRMNEDRKAWPYVLSGRAQQVWTSGGVTLERTN